METAHNVAQAPFGRGAFLTQVSEGHIVPILEFSGNALSYWNALVTCYRESMQARELVEHVAKKLSHEAELAEATRSGLLPHGLHVLEWIADESTLPPASYLSSSALSQPLIFLTQMGHVMRLCDHYRDVAPLLKSARGIIGHSQGVMAAVALAHHADGHAFTTLVTQIAQLLFWQGLRMQQSFPVVSVSGPRAAQSVERGEGMPSPMASVSGLSNAELTALLENINATLGPDRTIYHALTNGWQRVVLSAPPESLLTLREEIGRIQKRWQADITMHREVRWAFLPVTGPFHSPYVCARQADFRRDLTRLKIHFRVEDLRCAVFATDSGENLLECNDLMERLLDMMWNQPVDWPRIITSAVAHADATHILDLGPGEGTVKMTQQCCRGRGVAVVPLTTKEGREVVLSQDIAAIPWEPHWKDFQPRVVQIDGPTPRLAIDNAFTRFTKLPPIFGGGMTPTSVETDIVSAAANAGYLQEWAGGGQVTEEIWEARHKELLAQLDPGRGIIFNALFLDPYLWRLHFPKICEYKAQGIPYLGVTISAGVPSVEDASHILQTLRDAGIWMNALKPGSDAQVAAVLDIADANPDMTLLVHLEGGKAGGHHSWEDLAGLVRRNYAKLRARTNLILCVGGGIAAPAQAVRWLMGDWHEDPLLPCMPVDAVFLGTRLMACKEAKTSPQVKKLLVDVQGTREWVQGREIKGGVTSQKSQLNADVHFADTAAARAGALLDAVAGSPREKILQKKSEIIALINQTAKPYFGELTEMTYMGVLERMIALMAPGDIAAHLPQVGPWYDASFRSRAWQWVERLEARCWRVGERTPCVADATALNNPAQVVAQLTQRYPHTETLRLHPEDVEYFLFLCRQPGKPVNFVPIIDENVRRWYKADSLWQSHDPRFAAEAVFTIPGPEAVCGIRLVDEPIADIFSAFETAMLDALDATEAKSVSLPGAAVQDPRSPLRTALLNESTSRGTRRVTLSPCPDVAPDGREWLAWVLAQASGPMQIALLAPQWGMNGRLVDNPLVHLLAMHDTDEWQLEIRQGTLHALTTPWCRCRIVGKHVEWTVLHEAGGNAATAALVLRLQISHTNGLAPVVIDGEQQRRAVAQFYRTILPTQQKKPRALKVGLQFSGAWTLTREAIRAYVAATGETAASVTVAPRLCAPPMMTIVAAWQPFAEILLACGASADLLKLVHAGHAYELHTTQPLREGDRLETQLTVESIRPTRSGTLVALTGEMHRKHERVVTMRSQFFLRDTFLPESGAEASASDADVTFLPQSYTVFSTAVATPEQSEAYAHGSGDWNPIHRDARLAHVAGLDAPIVHGMWSAAAMTREVARAVAMAPAAITACDVRFTAPLMLGERCQISARHVGMSQGARCLDVQLDSSRGTAVTARVQVAPPRTAYLFTGQGSQMQGMGMAAYQRSVAARAVWDDAEAYCRSTFHFSLLDIVRENPTQLTLRHPDRRVELLRHPKGVLHLTQFAQVALTVVAIAHVAELREAGCLVPHALFAGHSLGEYAALSAADILPLHQVVAVVYHRGLTMQHFVPRDDQGRSPFSMAVVRPNVVGLDEAALEHLVTHVRDAGDGEIEIVNYNIVGEQYSVTGHTARLQALESVLLQRAAELGAEKSPWIWLPGIDVPFHSRILRDGVDAFRATLEANIPHDIDPAMLVDRYIPNLTAEIFALTLDYVERIAAETESPILHQLLKTPGKGVAWQPKRLARTLLIELLAYQFASPVQWIKTQEELVRGDVGRVDRMIEIGPQPVLANMARRTVRRMGVSDVPEICHIEDERQAIFYLYEDALETVGEMKDDGRGTRDETAETMAHPIVPVPSSHATAPTESLADEPLSIADALTNLLALKLHLRPDEIVVTETIERLSRGNSARRNEILADMGAEFAVGTIEEAHNKPLTELVALLESKGSYRGPGAYMRVATEQAIKTTLALGRRDMLNYLQREWQLGDGRVLAVLGLVPVAVRSGNSSGAGLLSPIAPAEKITKAADVQGWLDRLVEWYGTLKGVTVPRCQQQGATGGATVDATALTALEEKYFGREGIAGRLVRELVSATGADPYATVLSDDAAQLEDARRLRHYDAAFGPEFVQVLAPQFDAQRVVKFTSTWNWAKRNTIALYWDCMRGRYTDADSLAKARVKIARAADDALLPVIDYFANQAERGNHAVAQRQIKMLRRDVVRALQGDPTYRWNALESVLPKIANERAMQTHLRALDASGLTLAGKVIVITGAGPDSIGADIAGHALRAGAHVVVSSSRLTQARVHWWRDRFQDDAARGASLTLLPCNQGSREDVSALIDFIFDTFGHIDAFYPFAAIGEQGDLTTAHVGRSAATLRIMVQGIEWCIADIAQHNIARAQPDHDTLVVLPGSPNHGLFGGDGAYSEAKAALEVLTNRWKAEHESWGRGVALVGVRIGWTRGTGLMKANDQIADALEARTSCQTFSSEEMGFLLVTLAHDTVHQEVAQKPRWMHLTGGFEKVPEVGALVRALREEISAQHEAGRAADDGEIRVIHPKADPTTLAFPPMPGDELIASFAKSKDLTPDDIYVIVGYGEVSPGGNARTRWALECGGFTQDTALELAWQMGLVRFDAGERYCGWVRTDTNEPIADDAVLDVFGEQLEAESGIRVVDGDAHGFDPRAMTVFSDTQLQEPLRIPINAFDEAQTYLTAHPGQARVVADRCDDDQQQLYVELAKGALIKVPRAGRLPRYVAGQIPTGWDAARYGVPPELIQEMDPLALYDLVATIEAFLSMGLTPPELMQTIHPTRVGNCQGGGMGGQRALDRLFHNYREDQPRKGDALQETLINTMAAWVTQSYVGSYGPTVHPVGACATAVVSLDTAAGLLMKGQADFVVAGGYDDISASGTIGFHDMGATANVDEMLAKGMSPRTISRPNDRRRGGFVDAQGGGSILVTRLSKAAALGLPIYGVVAYTTTHSDGRQTSIPAPGLGLLGMVTPQADAGPESAPLACALARLGVSADDITVVSKHDTSTAANDPNENRLHHLIQTTLGRSAGHPLIVHSQKSFLGHAKGGAGAWQIGAALQMLETGTVPGNRNLEDVDPQMRKFSTLTFTDKTMELGPGNLRGVFLTSLGFGHVGAGACILHPAYALRQLPAAQRRQYAARRAERETVRMAREWRVRLGQEDAFALRPLQLSDAEEEALLLGQHGANLRQNTSRKRGLRKER